MKCLKILFLISICPFHLFAADYYWVGGSGNWSNISHWAPMSGGSVTYQQTPGPEDNVIFDANSFSGPNQVVTLNTDIAFFKDMSWVGTTNNPTFSGGANTSLNIFGGITLDDDMNFDFAGEVRFVGSTMGSQINFASHSAGQNVTFEGLGSWELNSPLELDSLITFLSGSLTTNGQPISCGYIYIEGDGNKSIDLGSSTISLSGDFREDPFLDRYWSLERKSFYADLQNLTFDAGTSAFEFTGKDPGFWIQGDGSISFYDVNFSFPAGDLLFYGPNATVNFNELRINKSAELLSKINMQTLSLSAANVYQFLGNESFDVSNIEANGDCASTVTIISSESGSPATFNKASGTVDISFITLRDIHTSGGAIFSANDAVDLGNNSGWNFTNTTGNSFFWIGGTGNWSDPGHWSFSSGGPSSGCVPAGKDDVFFDVNSFTAPNQVVTVDKANVYMRDMTWRGISNNGELAGDKDFRIRITGSLEFDTNMNHSFEGFYHFETSLPGQTIETNGIPFHSSVFFNGIAGEWSFLDQVDIRDKLVFTSGTLNTNAQTVHLHQFESLSNIPRLLNIEGSKITVFSIQASWQVRNAGFSIISEQSSINLVSGRSFFSHIDTSDLSAPQYDTILFTYGEGFFDAYNFNLPTGTPAVVVDHLIFQVDGFINGSSHFGELRLWPGTSCTITGEQGTQQIVDNLIASGDCEGGLTHISSNIPGQQSTLNISRDYTLDRVAMTDIAFSGGTVTANSSLDGGNNTNIIFTTTSGRTLYWVGNGGIWQDPMHWSLTSGGPGGECTPTSLDDVIFDENSFNLPNQEVDSWGVRNRYCNNITWTGTTNNPSFVNWYLNPKGSLTYDNSFQNYVWRTEFSGDGLQTVRTGGQTFNWIELQNKGDVVFVDDLEASQITHYSGGLHFDDINVDVDVMYFETAATKTANFGSSYISVHGNDPNFQPFGSFGQFLTLDAGTSTLDFTAIETGFQEFYNISFYNVLFSNPLSNGTIKNANGSAENNLTTFNSLIFYGSAETFGDFETDTLIGSAGKTYVLDSDRNMAVNSYFQMVGNNCTPIELRSSEAGIKANIEMPSSGTVRAEFIQMQDISASGGADFNAGLQSSDIGNSNSGWIFGDTPDFIPSGFLGPDRALCSGTDLVLNAYNFSPSEVYLWNDGSSDSTLTVNLPGTYFVEVEFQNACIIQDTIEIFASQDISASLPANPSICEGSSFNLDAEVPIAGAEYIWNTGESTPSINVTEAGQFSVQINVDGCISSAFSEVTQTSNPGLDLGLDRSVCNGEIFTLASNVVSDSYLWQDGSITPSISGILDGQYWVEIEIDACTFRDSVIIETTPRPNAEIGNDTTICSNEDLILSISNPLGHDVTWQDGSSNDNITVDAPGSYVVILDDDGCSDKDSIFVTIQDAPLLDLGDDLTRCEYEEIILTSNVQADMFSWDNGETTNSVTLNLSASTTVSLTITDADCTVTDDVNVNIFSFPIIDIGSPIQTLCDNEVLVLDAGSEGVWQDGSISQTFDILENGSYSVTVSNNGCETTASTEVSLIAAPSLDLGSDLSACDQDNVTLSVPNSFSNFQWLDGNMERNRLILESGLFILEVEENNCSTQDSIMVSILDTPELNLGQDTTVCDDEPFLLIPFRQSSGDLVWEDGSTNESFVVENSSLVRAVLSNDACSTMDSIQVNFKDCITFDYFIPNSFSPNDDGFNDYLEVFFAEGLVLESFDIAVFDRWGNAVYKSNDYASLWDGKMNSKILDSGVYIYIINVSYIDDFGPGEQLIKGNVSILK